MDANNQDNVKQDLSDILRDLRNLFEKCHQKINLLLPDVENSNADSVGQVITDMQTFMQKMNKNIHYYKRRFNKCTKKSITVEQKKNVSTVENGLKKSRLSLKRSSRESTDLTDVEVTKSPVLNLGSRRRKKIAVTKIYDSSSSSFSSDDSDSSTKITNAALTNGDKAPKDTDKCEPIRNGIIDSSSPGTVESPLVVTIQDPLPTLSGHSTNATSSNLSQKTPIKKEKVLTQTNTNTTNKIATPRKSSEVNSTKDSVDLDSDDDSQGSIEMGHFDVSHIKDLCGNDILNDIDKDSTTYTIERNNLRIPESAEHCKEAESATENVAAENSAGTVNNNENAISEVGDADKPDDPKIEDFLRIIKDFFSNEDKNKDNEQNGNVIKDEVQVEQPEKLAESDELQVTFTSDSAKLENKDPVAGEGLEMDTIMEEVVTEEDAEQALKQLCDFTDTSSDESVEPLSDESCWLSDEERPSVSPEAKDADAVSQDSSTVINDEPACKNLVLECKRVDALTEQELDRLCNLNNINKRKMVRKLSRIRPKRVKRRRKSINSSSSSSSSGSTTPDLSLMEDPIPDKDVVQPNEAATDNADLLQLLSDALHSSSGSGSETDIEKELIKDDNKTVDKSKENDKKNDTKQDKKGATKRPYDPLLAKFWSDTDDDGEPEPSETKDGGCSSDTEIYSIGDNLSQKSDSDTDNEKQPVQDSRNDKLNQNNKSAIVISDSEDSSGTTMTFGAEDENNSDIEFLNEYQAEDTAPTTKGRRNIREILDDEELAEETIMAKKEETQRIQRLEEHSRAVESLASQHEGLVLDVDLDTGSPLITVDSGLSDKLKPHQREGVQFMWGACYENVKMLKENKGSGCILAHCMGLGKTLQVIALIHTLFAHDVTNTKHVLIICPLSTVLNWKHEFKLAAQTARTPQNFEIYRMVNESGNDKCFTIKSWWKADKAVLIMGYEAFQILTNDKAGQKLGEVSHRDVLKALVSPGPDLVVCDEGHLLKNDSALRTQALMKIDTRRRIILTGTPLQNNLQEYYFMVQFVKPHYLGTFSEYKNRFVTPIMNGQYHDSTPHDINLMKKRTHILTKLLKKTIQRFESSVLKQYLPEIFDYTVFIRLHPLQVTFYQSYIEMATLAGDTLVGRFFRDFNITKYICLHPYVLELHYAHTKNKKPKENENVSAVLEAPNETQNSDCWYRELCPPDLATNLDYGSKLRIVWSIIEETERLGDKLLIFSHKLAELDCIEHFLKTQGTRIKQRWRLDVDYYRMDGSTSAKLRGDVCNRFNTSFHARVFLISHKVGSLGLNLTAANRVILLAPDFNPCHDSQSIYRVYRFGQLKKCFVYRLAAIGAMEEKMYQKCVLKSAVAGTVVDKLHIKRHYKNADLQAMYHYNFDLDSDRPIPKVPNDKLLANLLQSNTNVYKYHEHQALLENRPEEELNDEEKKLAWDEFNNESTNVPNNPPMPPLPFFPQPMYPSGPSTSTAGVRAQIWRPSLNSLSSVVNPYAARGGSTPLQTIRALFPHSPNTRSILGARGNLPAGPMIRLGQNRQDISRHPLADSNRRLTDQIVNLINRDKASNVWHPNKP